MIPGLSLIEDFITPDFESRLIASIDALPWDDSLHRRLQQYGQRYDHRARSIAGEDLGPLPPSLQPLCSTLGELLDGTPNQVIINEYLPGQGISKHIDSAAYFGEVVVSLSLLSGATIRFDDQAPAEDRQRHSLYLRPRSLLILKKDARYKWRHEIPKRSADPVGKSMIERSRRISVTFRTVLAAKRSYA